MKFFQAFNINTELQKSHLGRNFIWSGSILVKIFLGKVEKKKFARLSLSLRFGGRGLQDGRVVFM
jgi:hypothetical protein